MILLQLLLYLPLQAPGSPQHQGHPREEVEAYLALLLTLAEAMAAIPLPPAQLQLLSSAQPPEDPRARMVEDLRRTILNF